MSPLPSLRCLVLLALASLGACATRPPAPPPGAADVLPWGAVQLRTDESAAATPIDGQLEAAFGADSHPPARYALLALSGGGAKGAFGAGLMRGWSRAGTRPQFKVVTGVSTGALMASYVFLGPDYDALLERFYTTTTESDIYVPRPYVAAAVGDSIFDSAPLRATIARSVDAHLLDRVAAAHRDGRRLYVATTNLDGNRLVVWDMGAIAASSHPDRLQRYRDVLLASASIPIAFPPVYFPIEYQGASYGQMHVDGGAIANVFFAGLMVEIQQAIERGNLHRGAGVDFYMILNGTAVPQPLPEPIKPDLFGIASAVMWSMSWSAQDSQVARMYDAAAAAGFGFHLAGIPADYPDDLSATSFDPKGMTRLFRFAEDLAVRGYPWLRRPPGIGEGFKSGAWQERGPSSPSMPVDQLQTRDTGEFALVARDQ